MTLYEGNFIKLLALVPWLNSITVHGGRGADVGEAHVSCSPHDLDLHLAVEGITRYTIDFRLTYLFEDCAGDGCKTDGAIDAVVVAEPDLRLRVYLDARMVEAVAWSTVPRHRHLQALSVGNVRELDRRWARNIMLGKWLDYLVDRGHAFGVP